MWKRPAGEETKVAPGCDIPKQNRAYMNISEWESQANILSTSDRVGWARRRTRVDEFVPAFAIRANSQFDSKESGLAVGWPLNLGHNTTGWPLGLRLRLMHEDLQWPTLPDHMCFSSSALSTDSSSLDTMSTRSFFQDKSISLGAILGLPVLGSAGNGQHRHQQRQHQALLTPTAPASTPAAGPFRRGNRFVKSRRKPHRHRLGRSPVKQCQLQHQASTSSTIQGSPSAASLAGWCLLSFLSCTRVPARIGSPETEAGETVIPRAQLVIKQVHPSSALQDSELEPQESYEGSVPLPGPTTILARNSSQQNLNSLARKLYDNISFEDEELESANRTSKSESSSDVSKEWNPLFASSPQVARDEENLDNDDQSRELSGPMASPICDHSFELLASCNKTPLITLMRTSGKDSDALLYFSKDSRLRIDCSTSTTFCIDVRKWQQKQQQEKQQRLGHDFRIVDTLTNKASRFSSRSTRDFSRNKTISAFISRMVCCLSTPTRGSSF